MRLSIVVPTYNVEPWIEKCIRSLEDQNLPKTDYEIIVVNDGSPDKSAVIARELNEEFRNIKVIDQKNKGLAGARNTGVKNANGNYIVFVDPDDYIEKDCLQKMLFFVEDKNLDIGMFNQYLITSTGIVKISNNVAETKVISGIELYGLRGNDSACKYLIKRKYLTDNALYFYEEAVFLEDGEFSPRLHAKAARTAFKDIPFYFYCIRSGSLVTTDIAVSDKATDGYIKSSLHLKSFQKNSDLTNQQKIFLNHAIAKFVILPFTLSANRIGLKNFVGIKQKIKKAGINTIDSEGIKGMRRRHTILFNFSPDLLFLFLLIEKTLKSIRLRISWNNK
jgi:glycosyltransferase involved in cell wall biosynthesis